MGRPTDISRDQILDTARMLFLEHGIAGTEMKEIAALVGISRSSLYRYFGSKEDIAFCVAAQLLTALQLPECAGDPQLDGKNQLRQLLDRIVALLIAHRREVRLLDEFDQLFTDPYPESAAARDYVQFNRDFFFAPVEKALFRGLSDGSLRSEQPVRLLSRMLTNTLLAAAQRTLPRAAHLREEQGYAEEYLIGLPALLVEGLSAK